MAFTAGLPGKRTAKILEVKLVVWGLVACLWAFNDSTRGQFCPVSLLHQNWTPAHPYLQFLFNLGCGELSDGGAVGSIGGCQNREKEGADC